ncbi:MAG TPA: glycosyl hydrolase family 65 protein [Actinomycetota bacterium]
MIANAWRLIFEGYDPAAEGHREALCALGNGAMASRGAAPESAAGGAHYPGTYIAGVYNRLESSVGGRTIVNEDLVNVPNWLPLMIRPAGGGWLTLDDNDITEHRLELDIRRGVLTRFTRVVDDDGRATRVVQRKLVSMAAPHLAALETTITAENWSGIAEVRSFIDGSVLNQGVERYRELASRHLVPENSHVEGNLASHVTSTSTSRVRMAVAARTTLTRSGEPFDPATRPIRTRDQAGHHLSFDVREDVPVTIEKAVAIYTARDRGGGDPAAEAVRAAQDAPRFDALLERHVLAWDSLWRRCDLDIEGDERAQLVLRLHIFHLLQTVSENTIDLDVGVPARGLHGEAYRGHIFWDELFIFPFLNLRFPELTRALLRYRYRRLPAARRAARDSGLAGALFPWQSASDGTETSQTVHLNPQSGRWVPDNSHLQRHINAAVAYNVWRYYETTGDETFLAFNGAELLIETARLFASLAVYDRSRDRFGIPGVVGPDEYHDAYPGAREPGLDDNAYTNVMAGWVMLRALDAIELLPTQRAIELREKLALTREELEAWAQIARRMTVPFHDGVISQFGGYEQLADIDLDAYRSRYGDIHRLDRILEAEDDSPNNYKVSKQADVLMLFYLFPEPELCAIFEHMGYELDDKTIRSTIEYYLARTSHGSTLSSVVHSWVLARIDHALSWTQFTRALASDIEDVQGGTTKEGIHLGAMAGTVDLVQRCTAGLQVGGDALRIDPTLPEGLTALSFSIRYQDHWGIEVRVSVDEVRVTVPPSRARPIAVEVAGRREVLAPGEAQTFAL